MILLHKIVLLFDNDRFTLWNIPPLQPRTERGDDLEPILSLLTPVWTFSHPANGGYEQLVIPAGPWPQGTGRPHYFDICASDGEHTIAYYMLKPANFGNDHDLPPYIPVLMTSVGINSFEGGDVGESYGDLRSCDDWLVQPWLEEDKVVVNMTKMPDTRQGDTQNHTFVLWSPRRPSDGTQCFDLCTISGRVCCAVDDESQEIRVMDYIVPL